MIDFRLQGRFAAVFSVLFIWSLLAATPTSAQVNGNGWPPGSYVNSCKALSVDRQGSSNTNHWILKAQCKKADGKYIAASLQGAMACQGGGMQIGNTDGVLQCHIPLGSYVNSCNNIYVTFPNSGTIPDPNQGPGDSSKRIPTPGGTLLSANCKNESGNWVQTFYWVVNPCQYDIGNTKGQITCAPPPGNYRQTCSKVVMRDAANTYNGASTLWAVCDNGNGQQVVSSLLNAFDCFGPGSNIANASGMLTCQLPPGTVSNTVQSGPAGGVVQANCGPTCLP
jgi:hypothetical protein